MSKYGVAALILLALVGSAQSQEISAATCSISSGTITCPSGSLTPGTGVTSVSVTTANGVSGSVANPTTTPAISISLGAVTPTTVNGNTITTGTGTLTLGSVSLNAGAGGTLGSNAFTSTAYLPLAGGTLTGALLFTDNSFDIGAAGATRPRAGYFGTSVTVGAGLALTSTGAGGALGSNAFTSTAYAPLASPTFTGTVTIPTPFTLGAVSVTSTGTQLNYLSAATGTTGTTSTNVVFSTSPTLVTPILGAATGTSLALGGCALSANVLCGTGNFLLNGLITVSGGGITIGAGNSFSSSGRGDMSNTSDGVFQFRNAAQTNSITLVPGCVTATPCLQLPATTDAASSTGGALQVAGGASIAKRLWIPAISASAGLQTAVLCQSSGGEMIADSVACLASSARFKNILGPMQDGALAKIMKLPIERWTYKSEGIFKEGDWTRERVSAIAEDVAAMDQRLVGYDADGKVHSISTEQLLAFTIKALQEQQLEIRGLQNKIH